MVVKSGDWCCVKAEDLRKSRKLNYLDMMNDMTMINVETRGSVLPDDQQYHDTKPFGFSMRYFWLVHAGVCAFARVWIRCTLHCYAVTQGRRIEQIVSRTRLGKIS